MFLIKRHVTTCTHIRAARYLNTSTNTCTLSTTNVLGVLVMYSILSPRVFYFNCTCTLVLVFDVLFFLIEYVCIVVSRWIIYLNSDMLKTNELFTSWS